MIRLARNGTLPWPDRAVLESRKSGTLAIMGSARLQAHILPAGRSSLDIESAARIQSIVIIYNASAATTARTPTGSRFSSRGPKRLCATTILAACNKALVRVVSVFGPFLSVTY